MKTIPWQPDFTWRKLGYYSYSNSLDYRTVLSVNPEWSVITEPPIGAVIRYDSPKAKLGLQGTNITFTPTSQQASLNVYPYPNAETYIESLARYNPSSLLNVDRFNGWSSDTQQAFTGIQ